MRLFFSVIGILFITGFWNAAYGQTKVTLKGRVTDKDLGTGKPGVTISAGKPPVPVAQTDENGGFTITVSLGSSLLFSHAGYNVREYKVTAADTSDVLDIELEQSGAGSLQEIRVEGYRTKNRDAATGSSATISGKVLQDVPVSNVVELLQGKVAGLDVQNNNGSPGGMGTINLRGSSSLSMTADGYLRPTSPLFVVDGTPIDVNSGYEYGFQSAGPGISPIALIPPQDIEKVDVLRDAAATAQYGSRAAYGVIVITTKRGLSKVPIVSYSAQFFAKTPPKLRPILGGKEERLSRIQAILDYDSSAASALALINRYPALSDSLNPFFNNATDWQKYFFRTTLNQDHTIQVRGGDKTFNYKTNVNYYQEAGIIRNTGFKRYSLSMNARYWPVENFLAEVSLQGTLGQKQAGSSSTLDQDKLYNAIRSSTLMPASIYSGTGEVFNLDAIRSNNKSANILGALNLQWEFIKGLTLRNNFSYNFNSSTEDMYTPSYLNSNSSEGITYSDRRYVINNRVSLDFVKMIGDMFQLSGGAVNEISSEGFRASRNILVGFPNDQIEGSFGYNPRLSKGGILDNLSDKRIVGNLGYLSFNYDKRYVIDLNYRLDATSANGPSAGYLKNPSVSARWNFQKEKFLSGLDWLNYGAVRGSWGRTIAPTGDIFDVYGKYIIGQQYNNNPTVFIDLNRVPNIAFLPLTTTKTNFGVELGLFEDNRLEVNYDTYYETADNEGREINLPNTSGFVKKMTNETSLAKFGHELTLTLRVFKSDRPVQWTISANGALNRRVVTRLPGGLREFVFPVNDGGTNIPVVYRLGRELTPLILYNNGVYASTADVPVNPATGKRMQLGNQGFYMQGGDPRWVDVNGDYVIDDRDLLPLGNPFPKATGGIYSTVQYKNFMLVTQVNYTLARDLLNEAAAAELGSYTTNIFTGGAVPPIENYNYWKANPGDKTSGTVGAVYPNPYDFRRAGTLQPFRTNQSLFLEDGSYWKISQITLSYNFAPEFLTRFRMTSARLNLTAANVYTFSRYSGPDPELVTSFGRDKSKGYPNARTYSLGLSVQF
ncbi:SusC/RagA family TonB-linked outer membrane protein [Niabella beijingensis]|uniref:SusC/RagA family TonB-linked outer membrane protein n=1 Tax=Niabella beijingensis TaxID=2872700 RepID=UPI001CBE21D6|nr:SusC/RagA family TonB-linked outer membrane protein [Niabella beijingensis]MBZ4189079.1 SusC/RagA family TonB-linked outer membrane protein [Niabella beijingensis]